MKGKAREKILGAEIQFSKHNKDTMNTQTEIITIATSEEKNEKVQIILTEGFPQLRLLDNSGTHFFDPSDYVENVPAWFIAYHAAEINPALRSIVLEYIEQDSEATIALADYLECVLINDRPAMMH